MRILRPSTDKVFRTMSSATCDRAPVTASASGTSSSCSALLAATIAVVMARPSTPESLIFISLTIGAAGFAAVCFYRLLAPLVAPHADIDQAPVSERLRADLEREKALRRCARSRNSNSIGRWGSCRSRISIKWRLACARARLGSSSSWTPARRTIAHAWNATSRLDWAPRRGPTSPSGVPPTSNRPVCVRPIGRSGLPVNF